MKPLYHSIIVLSAAALICAVIFLCRKHPRQHAHQFSTRTFSQASGWGYDILVDGKLFIHQESIPAVAGSQGFSSRQLAENASNLLINKMKSGRAPVINSFDLQAIGLYDTTLHVQQSRHP